jgi:hypothetical protein
MSPLNDDELNSLLEQAKNKPPVPEVELWIRMLRAYQADLARPLNWRYRLLRPISIPLPLGMLAALLLVLVGAVVGRSFLRPSVVVQTRTVEVPVTQDRIVYRDCPAGSQESSPRVANLTFKEFQPVSQLRPRIVRSVGDEQ